MYNKAQRRKSAAYYICHKKDQYGYINFFIDKIKQGRNVIASFSSFKEAREYLFHLCENNNLCQKLCNLYESAGSCMQEEPVEAYNIRAKSAIDVLNFKENNFFIIDEGRQEEESAVIKIENGHYIGYGFCFTAELTEQSDLLHDVIENYTDNREIRKIINGYLHHNKVKKVMVY